MSTTKIDWQSRQFIQVIETSLRKCVDFLNNFHESAKYRLSVVDQRLSTVERQLDFISASLENSDISVRNPAPASSMIGSVFDPNTRERLIQQSVQRRQQAERVFTDHYIHPTQNVKQLIMSAKPVQKSPSKAQMFPHNSNSDDRKLDFPIIRQEDTTEEKKRGPPAFIKTTSDDIVVPQPPKVPKSPVVFEQPQKNMNHYLEEMEPGSLAKDEDPEEPGSPKSMMTQGFVPGPPKFNLKNQSSGKGPPPPPVVKKKEEEAKKPPEIPAHLQPLETDDGALMGEPATPEAGEGEGDAEAPFPHRDESRIDIKIVKPGVGQKPGPHSSVEIKYAGYLGDNSDGKNFINHQEVIVLGQRRNIKGLEQGVQEMQAGGTAHLWIPSSLGYGARGAGKLIPPNSNLFFIITMIKLIS